MSTADETIEHFKQWVQYKLVHCTSLWVLDNPTVRGVYRPRNNLVRWLNWIISPYDMDCTFREYEAYVFDPYE